MRISALTDIAETLSTSDVFVVDNESGLTRKISFETLCKLVATAISLDTYAKKAELPTQVSAFTNDRSYQTDTDVTNKITTHNSSADAHAELLAKKQDKLNDEQTAVINSGMTAEKIAKYNAYETTKQNALSDAQLAAANSGITADKVKQYDNFTAGSSTDIGLSVKNGMIQVTYER